ncbi:C-terminal binding protein [Nesterenkonia aerolata]|uniref:C-terminal binding protein n=1 Tax=Nesterenkonia aerolata TaxID=3074079 RepID=A0ABU2DU07_9MICC|nr:C-terminal binding protein [Nesterenkonia sp. LY-0111]MDR8019982.1 C-terminal binding protein [Nesterenkonia sp. LY-0111]
MRHVVVTDHKFSSLERERTIAEQAGASFTVHQATTEDELLQITQGADVLLVSQAPITAQVLSGLAPEATVVRYGIGVETVHLDAARRLGVRVCNVPDYGAETVADHTITLALASIRRIVEFDHLVRTSKGGWVHAGQTEPIPSLSEMTVGLIGVGQIGTMVARRFQAFNSRVIAADPYADPRLLAEASIELAEMPELLAQADLISLHTPLTPDTHHLLNEETVSRTKEGAILVNTARGGLVDTVAAADLVSRGHLGALAFDVFDPEPLGADHPLREAPRTILTPHAAFYSERSVRNLQRLAAEEMGRALRGETLRCEVRYG